jgi:hypothetical protein
VATGSEAGAGGLVAGVGDSLIVENDMAIAISATVKPIEKAIPNLSAVVIDACGIWTVNKGFLDVMRNLFYSAS